jgi:hypothetical protein
MNCQRALCLECATTWEGIHFCARCLAERRASARVSSGWAAWIVLIAIVAALFWLHGHVLVSFGVLFAELL